LDLQIILNSEISPNSEKKKAIVEVEPERDTFPYKLQPIKPVIDNTGPGVVNSNGHSTEILDALGIRNRIALWGIVVVMATGMLIYLLSENAFAPRTGSQPASLGSDRPVFEQSGSTSKSSDSTYQRTKPGYDPDAPLVPRYKGDIEPLYNEVERRKLGRGISDEQAVKEILEESERRP
jgi:hypothetical protein